MRNPSSRSSVSPPAVRLAIRRRAPGRAARAPRSDRQLAPLLLRIPSEAAMLAAFDRAQNVPSGRRVGIVADRPAHFVPPGCA